MYLSFEQVAVSTSVLDVDDLTIPATATHAEIQADTNNVRYSLDGSTSPTTSSGMLILNGAQPKTVLVADVRNIRFIRDATTDANLNLHYFAGRNV